MIQHVNVKIFAAPGDPVDLAPALTVFHRWIQEGAFPELLIDVADYRHVPAGPGVVLIGLEANYSLDVRQHRLGMLYNRKAQLGGSSEENIAQALRSAITACRKLEGEPEFEGKLLFDAGDLEILINDRLLAPNTSESFAELKPAIEQALVLVGRSGKPEIHPVLERTGESRDRLRIKVRV